MSHERILVVDDDASIRRVIHACLSSAGYTVEEASDGAQALDAMAVRRPDLVLLDLSMPVLDGMTVLAEMRAMLGDRAARTIAMTAYGSARVAARAGELRAPDVLEKPLTPDELRASVAGALADADDREPESFSPFLAALRSARDA